MILYRKKFAGPLLIGAAVGTALALAPAAHAEPPYAEIRRVLDPDRKLLKIRFDEPEQDGGSASTKKAVCQAR